MEVTKSARKAEMEHHIQLAEEFYRLAEIKFSERNYWKVTELCKQAIKNNPKEAKYFHLAAKAFESHPRFLKDAEEWFQKALEMEPWNPDFQLDFAKFFLKLGLAHRALNHCNKALEIMPEHSGARQLLNQLTREV
jgi:tetratricopeptide (TPR) repeat protein